MQTTLREITAGTVRQITNLSVGPDQQRFVASNAVSLAQALFSPDAWYRAIYADETPAGFVMLHDESLRTEPPAHPEVALWRFMVDAHFQGRGIGTAALDQVIAHVRSKRIFSSLLVSYVPGPGSPEGFYLRAGFAHTRLFWRFHLRFHLSQMRPNLSHKRTARRRFSRAVRSPPLSFAR
jgi:diamine N-acetyltransferase